MSDDLDLSNIVYEFALGLPDTVRSDILVFVIVYAAGEGPFDVSSDTFTRKLRSLLIEHPRGMVKFGAILRVIAALDHVLARARNKVRESKSIFQALEEKMPETARPMIERMQLGQPLRQRHLEQALSEWRKLRDTRLTAQNLEDFEDWCLSQPSQK